MIIFARLEDRILLFRIPIGTRNNFFDISRLFGYAPSKSFASSALGGADIS